MTEQHVPTDTRLSPQDDGLMMRESGRWVAEKLFYLKRYLDMFSTAMSKKDWRALNYIDLFCGPGKCWVREDGSVHLGSPLLALTAPRPFTNLFFVDCEASAIEALKERANASPLSDRVRYYVGDSNIEVHKILDYVKRTDAGYRPGEWPSLNLAFLDPEGLELRWDTVAALAEVRTDLIIHYSQMGVARAAPVSLGQDEETVVDRYFGGREWRSICRSPRSTGRLLEHYVSNLRELGYEEVRRNDELWSSPLIRSWRKRAPLYRLLFASRSPLGHEFWRKVTSKDVYGQKRLF